MRDRIKKILPLVIAALFGSAVTVGGPALATAAFDAQNAHKVDGFHAVGSGASIIKRAGKLVATNAQGRLPNNIIARAPDATRLGGYSHAQMSAVPLLIQGAGTTGTATSNNSGVTLSANGTGGFTMGFVVPPDHKNDTPLLVDLVYGEFSAGACSWEVSTAGLQGPDSPTGDDIHNGAWNIPTGGFSGPIDVPAGEGKAHKATFSWNFHDEPGGFVQFTLSRSGDAAADTCGGVTVYAAQLRY